MFEEGLDVNGVRSSVRASGVAACVDYAASSCSEGTYLQFWDLRQGSTAPIQSLL